MTVTSKLVSRLEKLAALVPLIVVLWAAVSWGLTADADIETLKAHDAALNATDRLARLEMGQVDTNKRLDHIEGQLDILVGRGAQ